MMQPGATNASSSLAVQASGVHDYIDDKYADEK